MNPPAVIIPSYEEVSESKRKYAEAFMLQYNEQDAMTGRTLVQKHADKYVVQNPPPYPLTVKEMDGVYALPFERTYHPSYEEAGGIPAIKEVEFSITDHRGCFGGCSFCSINFHQGRIIQKRSETSILDEAQKLVREPDFKGYIHDLGGPTANFRNVACEKQKGCGACKSRQCLYPQPCKNLIVDHGEYLEILRKLRQVPGVKKVFIRSGIRYDYLLEVASEKTRQRFMNHLVLKNVSGQLKVAPEHVDPQVLDAMGKPKAELFDKFSELYRQTNEELGKRQFLIPYFIAAHPGSTLDSAIELALYMHKTSFVPDQVQEFYPTPGTVSTCMYYTGLDPRPQRNYAPIYIPKGRERHLQRALLQYNKAENRSMVIEALEKANRKDLSRVLLTRR